MTYCKHICINFKNMKVYATGNTGYQKFIEPHLTPSINDIRVALYKACSEEGGGKNYNEWAKELNEAGLRYFSFIPVLDNCPDNVNLKVREIISQNQWFEVSKSTKPTQGHIFYK